VISEQFSTILLTICKVLIFYALLTGLAACIYWVTIFPICAEIVGLKNLNAALSVSFFNLVLPLTFSEPIALEITSHTGSYLGTQLFTGSMYVAGAICLWILKAWKVGDLERTSESEVDSARDLSKDYEAGAKSQHNFLTRLFIWRKV
jgi:predicted MFS family arabinose efflux permease